MEIAAWLETLDLGQYAQAFVENGVDAEVLPCLTADDLKEIGVRAVGHRRKLIDAIAALRAKDGSVANQTPKAPATVENEARSSQCILRTREAERRQLTVMFVDLVGSTALSARLDPEEMRNLLRAYHDTVTGEVVRAGGHVAKLMGDGVLAYFGWPQADEDDAERAVRAGVAAIEAVQLLHAPDGGLLDARVGIASGLVIVGDLIGEGAAREDWVVGETPNLAARLQQVALSGTVTIAEHTRQLLGDVYELHRFEPGPLKGFSQPGGVYRVGSERQAGSRFEARRSGRLLPMVGRRQELALILERWWQAVAGEGQAVLLVGEPGIGKSRLVQAVLDGATAVGDHTVIRYQCSPHHSGTALWPVVQQLRSAACIDRNDSDVSKFDKLAALLKQGADDVGLATPLLAVLIGIETHDSGALQELSPQHRRTRTLAVLVEQLLGLARTRPVLWILEDAHWIDPTTLELVGQALHHIAGARVLLLLTSRPEKQPIIDGRPQMTRFALSRLGREATEAIVAQLSGASRLPHRLSDEIAARADGVPLYIEELTKAVLESGGAGSRLGTVPASLHASLMARLDRLPDVKEIAQVAACIGRVFHYRMLAAVSPRSEAELQVALHRLVEAELVFSRGAPPEASYTFKHALVRDAAHESLLRTQRQHIHATIVRALEERFPETVEREPELLALHCGEARLTEQAIQYWQRAGHQALTRSALTEAITHLGAGLELVEHLPVGRERQRRELGLQLALGHSWLHAKGFAASETGGTFARAHELCLALGDGPEMPLALYGRCAHHAHRGELAVALEVARELLHWGQQQADGSAIVAGHRMVGVSLCLLGRLAESREHLEAGAELYDLERDRTSAFTYASDSRVMCLVWLSQVLVVVGYPKQGAARLSEALAHASSLSQLNTSALAFSWGCMTRQLLRDVPNALKESEAAIALATEMGFPLYLALGNVVRGWALACTSGDKKGVELMRRGFDDYHATGAEMLSPYFLTLRIDAEAQVEHVKAGLSLVAAALESVDRTQTRWIQAELHRFEGQLLLAAADPDRTAAEDCLRRGLAVAEVQGAKLWELRSATSLARLWRDGGRRRDAHDLLAPIYGWFTEGFDTPDLEEARALLDSLR
jgi:class 3 adenylate cyclase/predicted ATPase